MTFMQGAGDVQIMLQLVLGGLQGSQEKGHQKKSQKLCPNPAVALVLEC